MEPASNDNPARQQQPPPPPPPPPAGLLAPPPHRKCPRCDSTNTKFCYYNNYSLTQPRYFCKACRRYWTHGGTLRNVPIGGGCRKNKHPSKASSNLPSRCQNSAPLRAPPPPMNTSFFSGSGGGVFFPAPYASIQASSSASGVILGGGGGGQFGANLSLLQAMSLQSLESPAANQLQPPGSLFPAQQNLMNPVMRPWAQNLNANTAGGSSSSASGSTFWNNVTGVGDQAGPSFSAPDQWLTDDDDNNNPGFNPSQ